jgi:hypothetical protein
LKKKKKKRRRRSERLRPPLPIFFPISSTAGMGRELDAENGMGIG